MNYTVSASLPSWRLCHWAIWRIFHFVSLTVEPLIKLIGLLKWSNLFYKCIVSRPTYLDRCGLHVSVASTWTCSLQPYLRNSRAKRCTPHCCSLYWRKWVIQWIPWVIQTWFSCSRDAPQVWVDEWQNDVAFCSWSGWMKMLWKLLASSVTLVGGKRWIFHYTGILVARLCLYHILLDRYGARLKLVGEVATVILFKKQYWYSNVGNSI